jgi:tellurite resistance protein
MVTDSWWDGDQVMGKIEVLNTPKGQILQSLLDAGVTIGISSRGVGSTEKKRMAEGDVDMVNDDFQLICYDIVSEPSTPGAYLFKEGRSIDFDPKKTWNRADRIFRALNEIVRK